MKTAENLIVVGLADGRVALAPDCLISYALGSCVGICLIDTQRRLAGMAHILLPDRQLARDQNNPYKFADSAVDALIRDMLAHGARESELKAKLAGGASMFHTVSTLPGIGQKNILAARQAVNNRGIRIVAEDTGADYGRTICLDPATGRLRIKTARNPEQWI